MASRGLPRERAGYDHRGLDLRGVRLGDENLSYGPAGDTHPCKNKASGRTYCNNGIVYSVPPGFSSSLVGSTNVVSRPVREGGVGSPGMSWVSSSLHPLWGRKPKKPASS